MHTFYAPRWGAAFFALGVLAMFAAASASAMTERELELRVLKITEELRCPTCQADSVRDSAAAFSRQIRDKVRAMIVEGKSDDEIKAHFVISYGEWILRAPKKEGVALLLWGLPIAGIVVAGGLLFWRQRRVVRAARKSAASTPGTSLDDSARSRIEQDLRRFERGF